MLGVLVSKLPLPEPKATSLKKPYLAERNTLPHNKVKRHRIHHEIELAMIPLADVVKVLAMISNDSGKRVNSSSRRFWIAPRLHAWRKGKLLLKLKHIRLSRFKKGLVLKRKFIVIFSELVQLFLHCSSLAQEKT